MRDDAPARYLRLDPDPRGLAGDVHADHAHGTREVLPIAQGEGADLGIRRNPHAHPAARATQAPLHPAVAEVEDEGLAHRILVQAGAPAGRSRSAGLLDAAQRDLTRE